MDSDAPRPIVQRQAPDLQRLPEILEVHIRWRQFDKPRRVTVAGKDTFHKEAMEFEVRVSEPFQVRALGPVLWVGDEPLTIADEVSTGVYRFYSFAPDRLRPSAPIALAWNSSGAERRATKYTYSVPRRD
jgi:hypothetical protein